MLPLKPDAATVAAIIRDAEPDLAAGLLEHPAVVEEILHDTDMEARPGVSELRASAQAVVASWTWESVRGPRALSVTVLQVTIGGRDRGEGWGEMTQYVSLGTLLPDEARTLAGLSVAGLMPSRIGWKEL